MKWFEGTVEAAVERVRARSALLVVLVEGDDDKSAVMLDCLESVQNADNEDYIVALRINRATRSFRQFSQIYPVTSVPITYLIGSNGTVLGVVEPQDDKVSMITKFTQAFTFQGETFKDLSRGAENANSEPEKIVRQRKKVNSEDAKKKAEEETKPHLVAEPEAKPAQATTTDFVRLQFRLPDGSSVNHRFRGTDKLMDVFQFVKEVVGSSFGQFALHVAFPNRELNANDSESSLVNLELAPSAAIMVIPVSRVTVTPNWMLDVLRTILRTIFFPLFTVSAYLFGRRAEVTENADGAPETSTTDVRKKRLGGMKGSTSSKLYANVHSLGTSDSDDDENNTWNGNSTQQM